MSIRTRLVTVGLAAAVAVVGAPLLAAPAQANPGGTDVVISEVYGAGGNSGAVVNQDYVELFNPTAATIDLSNYGITYFSATGGSGGTTRLTGTIAPSGHYLVGEASGGSVGAALPTPDVTGTINMSATAGRVILFTGTAPTTADPAAAGVVDFVGFGTTAATFEGTGRAPAPSTTLSITRKADASVTYQDTDDNAADFTATAPSPENSGGSGGVTPPTPDPTQVTIEQIQGTGPASPLVGQTVKTSGVVTASYPDGGFFGFYLQQPDGTDPAASDGVFVYRASGQTWAFPAIGATVDVTGSVTEFNGLTEVSATGVTVTGTGAITPLATAYPTTETAREALEGMLIAPTGDFTVSNSYSINQYGEVGLVAGTALPMQPTEVCQTSAADCVAAVEADNAARMVTLDDGATVNYMTGSKTTPLPWLTQQESVRVGAAVTFHQPVVLDWRNAAWKFEPTTRVIGQGADVVTFADTRTANLTPADVGGNVKIATFNVLNYFNTTGEAYVARSTPDVPLACTYYDDRDGNHIANNTCGQVRANGSNAGNGPRGAATDASLARQTAKIVTAIDSLGADVVALEEIENSLKIVGETDRDAALAALVTALNAAAGPDTWAYIPSPQEAIDNIAVQDVIRIAFIYKPAVVTPVGESDLFLDESADASVAADGTPIPAGAFANAREPLAQAFKLVGAPDSTAFAVVGNHFKSKGDSNPPATGDNANSPQVGAFNGDRTRQAAALVGFANGFAAARGAAAVFLVGDFNAYSQEDPMLALYAAGYTAIESPGEETYSYSGLSGSLDHVLGNAAAMALVTGADVWDINAAEPVAYQYSRYNYNITQLFDAMTPFAASDHNPEIVGLNIVVPPPPVTDQITLTLPPDLASGLTVTADKKVKISVTVNGAPADKGATVTLLYGSTVIDTVKVNKGVADLQVDMKGFPPGTYELTLVYQGAGQTVSRPLLVTVVAAAAPGNSGTAPGQVKKG